MAEKHPRRASLPPPVAPVTENSASRILMSVGEEPARPPKKDARAEELMMIRHDLATASQVQDRLLPENLPIISGYEFDAFYLYTDGVTELMDAEENEFGKTRFVQCTLRNAHRPSGEYVQALVKELQRHRGGPPQSDDITIVTGRTTPEEQMLS